jgi:hypothetical protein
MNSIRRFFRVKSKFQRNNSHKVENAKESHHKDAHGKDAHDHAHDGAHKHEHEYALFDGPGGVGPSTSGLNIFFLCLVGIPVGYVGWLYNLNVMPKARAAWAKDKADKEAAKNQ